jgi:glutathione peroxidase
MTALTDFTATTIDGHERSLADHAGEVVLVVNTASECGYTPQLAGLEALHQAYRDRGFTVLGFPCNQFGEQEPGSHEEIATFCSTNYGVTFPMFEKIEVNGEDRHPIYQELTKTADTEGHDGDIRWNFEKFLVDRDGNVVGRFGPQVEPESDEVVGAIEAALG